MIPADRECDVVCELRTTPGSALVSRLSGDYNPLHCDPDVAAKADFPMPILHGLCTYGSAGHALLRTLWDYDTSRFRGMHARFSSPVYPGETIRTGIWHEGSHGKPVFRSRVVERDIVVLDQGTAEIAA